MPGRRNHYRDRGFTRGSMGVRGAAEVARALRQAGEHIEAAAKAALKEGVDIVVNDAKNRCPVYEKTTWRRGKKVYEYFDKRQTPGKLRDSIKAYDRYGDGSWYNISANAHVETPKGRLYYGAIVEFSPKINRPFLYPALDANRATVYKRIKNAIREATERGKT